MAKKFIYNVLLIIISFSYLIEIGNTMQESSSDEDEKDNSSGKVIIKGNKPQSPLLSSQLPTASKELVALSEMQKNLPMRYDSKKDLYYSDVSQGQIDRENSILSQAQTNVISPLSEKMDPNQKQNSEPTLLENNQGSKKKERNKNKRNQDSNSFYTDKKLQSTFTTSSSVPEQKNKTDSVTFNLVNPGLKNDSSTDLNNPNIIAHFVRFFNPSNDLVEGYRKLNEEDALIQLYNKAESQRFEFLTEDQYKNFISKTKLFNKDLSKETKIFNLMLWAQLAGCPLLGVNQHHSFFHSCMQVYSPQDAEKQMELHLPKKISEMTEEERNSTIETYPYEKECQEVGIQIKKNKYTYKTKPVTQDLKENAIIYLYLNAQKKNIDKNKYNSSLADHYKTNRIGRISYKFLQDYIIPLSEISYLDTVLEGLERLPKSIVNLLRGKAIYLSSSIGPSITLSSTSHNMPITSYLGFLPGIFIEHNVHKSKAKFSTLTGNDMTFEAVLHEIGHLIDQTVLMPRHKDLLGNESIPFFYQFPEFIEFNSKTNRDNFFRGNIKYLLDPNSYFKSKNDQTSGIKGYMTHYSEKNRDEDFAEHFKFYILEKDLDSSKKIFDIRAKKEGELLPKYHYMRTLVEYTDSAKVKVADKIMKKE